ncbi:hypothetical protein E2C01_026728 [Portunus trituberculatus]|uniref:Uncharacterized protein n=1 Tax=Portunus trituberculatus TaxID=210409 RepID=A0A5B7EJQ2_PORTR|nr:hypothetical protein [Portunus trituberculatus]
METEHYEPCSNPVQYNQVNTHTWLSMQSQMSSSSSYTWQCWAMGHRASTAARPFTTTTRSTPAAHHHHTHTHLFQVSPLHLPASHNQRLYFFATVMALAPPLFPLAPLDLAFLPPEVLEELAAFPSSWSASPLFSSASSFTLAAFGRPLFPLAVDAAATVTSSSSSSISSSSIVGSFFISFWTFSARVPLLVFFVTAGVTLSSSSLSCSSSFTCTCSSIFLPATALPAACLPLPRPLFTTGSSSSSVSSATFFFAARFRLSAIPST